ncbi:hypothetical protein ACFL6Q_01570 [Candidatus Neomarinimicrobiota bacterium]
MLLLLTGGLFDGCDNPVEGNRVFTCVEDSVTTCWTAENSPYIITDTTIVDSGEVLMIEPGVVVRFAPLVPLIVKGTLGAEGTAEDSIKFLPIGKSVAGNWLYWGGITLENCSDNSIITSSQIRYCWEPALHIRNCSPTISHSTLASVFTDCEGGGVIIFCEGHSFPRIEHNTLLALAYGTKGVFSWLGANPRIKRNDFYCGEHGAAVVSGGFLDENYLAERRWNGEKFTWLPDLSLGEPKDTKGDGVFTTTSTDSLRLFWEVDGVVNPRSKPNNELPDWVRQH